MYKKTLPQKKTSHLTRPSSVFDILRASSTSAEKQRLMRKDAPTHAPHSHTHTNTRSVRNKPIKQAMVIPCNSIVSCFPAKTLNFDTIPGRKQGECWTHCKCGLQPRVDQTRFDPAKMKPKPKWSTTGLPTLGRGHLPFYLLFCTVCMPAIAYECVYVCVYPFWAAPHREALKTDQHCSVLPPGLQINPPKAI